MRSNLYIHTITVTRYGKVGVNKFGASSKVAGYPFGSNAIGAINEIPCRVEEYKEKTEYRDSNIRVPNKTLVYIDPAYILQDQDLVYWGSLCSPRNTTGELIGRVNGVNPAVRGVTNMIDHWEVTIENE